MGGVVLEQREQQLPLRRDLEPLGPEGVGEFGRRLHDDDLICIELQISKHADWDLLPWSTAPPRHRRATPRSASRLRVSRPTRSVTQTGFLVASGAMSGPKRPFERGAMLDALRAGTADDPFDVLVIGGGITGVGVALDAAARGLRTALVERDDFASGTSSKSSKMVHGGLRYLQNGDVRLVYEALRERRRLMKNAPHLVEILPFMIPILTKDGVVSKKVAKALGSAMWMYDLTGGWRIGKLHQRVSAEQAAAHFPTTHLDKLSAGYLYFDAAADDARLALTVARTAAEPGAVVANRCPVVDVTLDRATRGQASGVMVEADGETFHVAARCIVNAAGVWADEVRALDETEHPDSIRPAKGVHITVPWDRIRVDIAVIIPVRADQPQPVPRALGAPPRRNVRTRLRRHHRHGLRRSAG